MDGRSPAVPKKPWNVDSPVNTNKQWFPMVSNWCIILPIRNTYPRFGASIIVLPRRDVTPNNCHFVSDTSQLSKGNRPIGLWVFPFWCMFCQVHGCWHAFRFVVVHVRRGACKQQFIVPYHTKAGSQQVSPLFSDLGRKVSTWMFYQCK